MDNEIVECLIGHVKIHEFLYDVCHKDYKNVSLKHTAWEAIGRELNLSGEAVRNKWKTIRDGYTKYKKQLKVAAASNKKTSYYIWSSQLAFLDDYHSRSNETAETPSSPSLSIQAHNSELAQYFAAPISPNIPTPPDLPALPTTSTTRFTQRQTRRQNQRTKNTNNDDVRKVIHYLKKKEHDGIDHLFLSYAETFKKFPAREQALMKIELAKLFSNTELQLIQNTSHHMLVDVNEDIENEGVNVKEEDDLL